MLRIAVGLVVLLLAGPAADDDKLKDKDKPTTPAAEYQALVKEYNDAQQAFFKEYQEAKDQDKPKLLQEKYPKPEKYAPKFLELAEKNPKDPVAVDALVWIVTNRFGQPNAKDGPRAKALAILTRDHVTSDKIGAVCQSLIYQTNDPPTEALLRAILDKNPSQPVQAEACLALALGVRQQIEVVRALAGNPSMAKSYEQAYGKEYVEALKKKDAPKIEAESDQLFQRFADKYVAALKPERLATMFQMLSYSQGKGGEKLLRTLLEKDTRREVQGVACLTLAQMLKRQADAQPAEQGEKVRKESEALFERAIDTYADVKMQFYGTVGKKAKGELHALRFLAVGKPAPEVEGVDQDGQKFKLSDYKGKVVMLDFWSQF